MGQAATTGFGEEVEIPGNEKLELQELERSADDLLEEIATSPDNAPDSVLRLEKIAERAAKIAFGSGRADLLTDQMYSLIKWTDHLNDVKIKDRFCHALRHRPLAAPW